jgi:hypothetical protein
MSLIQEIFALDERLETLDERSSALTEGERKEYRELSQRMDNLSKEYYSQGHRPSPYSMVTAIQEKRNAMYRQVAEVYAAFL